MSNIVAIHNKILDFLLKRRIKDQSLYFLPRKRNNVSRLDKGYWFLGNDEYVHVSFWEGSDWKEKIHNIGFVVLNNHTCYIELSAQDSDEKANFLSLVANKLGGGYKHKSKNKWFKDYEDNNYI